MKAIDLYWFGVIYAPFRSIKKPFSQCSPLTVAYGVFVESGGLLVFAGRRLAAESSLGGPPGRD